MKSLFLIIVVFISQLIIASYGVAQNWTQVNWPYYAVASSADGTKLIAYGASGICLSTNSGTSWTTNINLTSISLLSSSADGTKLVALSNSLYVYASADSGATWVTSTLSQAYQLFSLTASGDGRVLIAIDVSGFTFISQNYGASWVKVTSFPGNKVVISADASKWYCAAYDTTNFYSSTNYGTSWQKTGSFTNLILSIAASADGSKLIAGTFNGSVYTSTNSGINWLPQTNCPATNWFQVASSADGSRLIAAAHANDVAGPIYTSTDSGVTWISNNIANQIWSGIVSSADGGSLIAFGPGSNGSYVYTSQVVVRPRLNLVLSGANQMLSWLAPSTNFVLQQNQNLTATNWLMLTNASVLNLTNLQEQITMQSSNNSKFYRLVIP